jgi:hypothetical protein
MAQANPTAQTGSTDLHNLDVKALTSAMVVMDKSPGMWTVVSTHEHTVGRVNGEYKCDCKGNQFGHECYHIRRLKFELGAREIPAWTNEEAIDEKFREFIDPE